MIHEIVNRFETIALKVWERIGIRQAGFWTVSISENNHDLIYLVEWEIMAEREKSGMPFKQALNSEQKELRQKKMSH